MTPHRLSGEYSRRKVPNVLAFSRVCHAVQHAHQKGIIHRDLKPSNILICLYDGHPVPKVIDFGLAKAMHHSLTEQSIYTAYGMMVGTPLYMSPEQAEQNNLDIDTRTDIYALGVILYELLTGTTPLEKAQMKEAAYGEVLRLIKEVEPPKPSTRLSGSESLPSVAAQRGIEPAQLTRSITGDLDWVVMKALEKERSRRYETANGLAEDIRRHLADEPVSASPPSTSYRMKKFIRRNRAGVIAAGAIAIALLLGVMGTTGGMFWALDERKEADAARKAESDAKLRAEANMKLAEQQTELANAERKQAIEQRKQKEHQLRIANAMRLAAQSQTVAEELPVRSLLLAIEAVETTRKHDGSFLPLAHETLMEGTARVGGRALIGHEGYIYSAAVSPDSRWLVTGGGDWTARLWDLTTEDPTASSVILRGHEGMVGDVAISPDGRWVVTASYDKTARVWDLTADDPASFSVILRGHEAKVIGLKISPDSRWLVTKGFRQNTARLWDLTADDPSATSVVLKGHEHWVNDVAISPDSRWLVNASPASHN